jgi:hypothetical protein
LFAVNPFLMFSGILDKVVAVTVCIALVCAPIPVTHAAASDKDRTRTSDATPPPSVLTPPSSHFLRDAVPSAGFAAEPEDTTDDYFLPEEKDTKKLVWEIAAWVVGAAIVGFFIIKVFIEEDAPEPTDDGNGKNPPS